jgi:hypothetical protein
LDKVLVARSATGVCAILIGSGEHELKADLAVRFPKSKLSVKDADVQIARIRLADGPFPSMTPRSERCAPRFERSTAARAVGFTRSGGAASCNSRTTETSDPSASAATSADGRGA